MVSGLRIAAAIGGLSAWLAMSGAATAGSITYDLIGDADAAYPCCGIPDTTFIDLIDPNTGSSMLPGYTLNVGDHVDLTVTLNHAVTFNGFYIGLQDIDSAAEIQYNSNYTYYSGGGIVSPPPGWYEADGTHGALGFAGGIDPLPGSFSFDKVIVSSVISWLVDASGTPVGSMPVGTYSAYLGLGSAVTTTPVPAALPLFATALGGLGFVGWRRRKAAA